MEDYRDYSKIQEVGNEEAGKAPEKSITADGSGDELQIASTTDKMYTKVNRTVKKMKTGRCSHHTNEGNIKMSTSQDIEDMYKSLAKPPSWEMEDPKEVTQVILESARRYFYNE